jgi:hypothetical protein
MKQKFGAGGWLLNNHPLVCIPIDVENPFGIRTSKRDRTAFSIKHDSKALSPGHRQLSGEPEF